MRLSEVAEAADVSVATVNRFCQTVGCGGFKDFKIIVAQSAAVSMQYLTTNGTGANADTATEVIKVIANADRLVFFGLGGGSSTVAIEGANRFFRRAYIQKHTPIVILNACWRHGIDILW